MPLSSKIFVGFKHKFVYKEMIEKTRNIPRFKLLEMLQNWSADLSHLIYPASCLVCEDEVIAESNQLCVSCFSNLHFTHFEKFDEPSELDQVFWGRVPLVNTCALLRFQKNSGTQNILHAIKYAGKQKLAVEMGALFGQKLMENSAKYGTIEALIPVPLHPKKAFLRGFNQSERIAAGIASVLAIPVDEKLLTRGVFTESQTKKSRMNRWDNVSDVFRVDSVQVSNYSHIALVDDVVTTGSTLESCVQIIQNEYPKIKISILSLAIAK